MSSKYGMMPSHVWWSWVMLDGAAGTCHLELKPKSKLAVLADRRMDGFLGAATFTPVCGRVLVALLVITQSGSGQRFSGYRGLQGTEYLYQITSLQRKHQRNLRRVRGRTPLFKHERIWKTCVHTGSRWWSPSGSHGCSTFFARFLSSH